MYEKCSDWSIIYQYRLYTVRIEYISQNSVSESKNPEFRVECEKQLNSLQNHLAYVYNN